MDILLLVFRSMFVKCLILFVMASYPGTILANWTLNIGYHNPPVSTFGLNLLYWQNSWAFEVGIGWVDGDVSSEDEEDGEEEEDSVSVSAAGGMNLKFFLGGRSLRPYLQLGMGAGLGVKAGDDGGAGAGVGGGYGGVGVLVGSPAFYAYGSFNLNSSENSFLQLGLGFDI